GWAGSCPGDAPVLTGHPSGASALSADSHRGSPRYPPKRPCPRRPPGMTRNRTILALVAILAIGAGGYLAYDNVLRGDSVAPLSLPSTSPTSVATSTPSATGASDPAVTQPSADAATE